MQGLQYDANSAQVPRNQQSLLNTTNSWAKPQPGYKYYDGNVPIEVYKETAAIAGQSETIDGEPETTVAEDAACTKAKLNDEDTDEDDSATYWPSSPIPESPHIQPPLRQGLPPDSSFESLKNSPQKKFAARPVATAPSPSGNTAEDVPSSPPDGNAYINSDDEMDMEVPRGLGEESPKKLKDRTIPTRAAKASGSDMSRSQSMVQVKETPHAKEKNQGLRPGGSSATLPNQTSSGTSGNISSISMVPGTYNDPTSSNSNGATKATQEDTADNDDVMMDEPSYMPQETGTHSPAPRASAKNRHFVQLPSSPVSGRSPLPPSDSIPANSSTNSKSTPSIEHTVKRKSDTSPSNINPRQTKRREIKVHKFSGLSQLSQDPVAAYRQEKKASMEKFRAERLNTTESPNLAGYNNGDSDVSQDSFAKRQVSVHSPQKMELDHEPRTPQTPQNATQRPQVLLADAASPSTPSSTANIFGKFRQAYPDYKGDVTHFANQCKQIYTLEQGDKMVPKWMWDDFLIRNRTDFKDYALRCMDAGEDPGPYIRYYKDHIQKTIYEKGILKDVATLAKALGELGYDLPLSTGPATARNQGLPRRSLIGTTNSPLSTPGWRQRSIRPGLSQGRQSLPDRSQDQNHVSGGHTNRDPLKQSGWKAPRHSYPETTNPVKAKTNPRAPQKTINPMSGHTNGLGQAIEMTGDAFRDFVLAQKKMTAVTGSTKVRCSSHKTRRELRLIS
jgi:hypothetical protein